MITEEKLIKNKFGLLKLTNYLKNVSEACRVMGYRRDTFYRVRKAYKECGFESLHEKYFCVPNIGNRVVEYVEQAVVVFDLEDSLLEQKRVSDILRQREIFISPAGVHYVWLKHNLETFQKRLKVLEAHLARTGKVVTELQLKVLEKAKEEKIAWDEIETEHVGYLGTPRHLLCGYLQRCRSNLSADVH